MHHLTQRELMYLDDFLKSEQLTYKSMNIFAEQCTDQSVKQLCLDSAQSHKQNFQTMLKHINSGTLQ